jgi:transcription initiation factor TFIIIB Brf1 subunit/transcription initiation factor TFIIB
MNCGCVHRREYSNEERRAYTSEEISNRKRTEPIWRSFGSRTLIGNINADISGNKVALQNRILFARLNKIQNSLMNSLERNYWESKPKLMTAANKLCLPSFIQETAWRLYSEVAKNKLTQGRSINGFVSASLYVAIRIHEFPKLLEEIVEVTQVTLRDIHKAVVLIIRYILPKLNLRYKPVRLDPLLYRFGNELDLSMAIQQKAHELLKYALKN